MGAEIVGTITSPQCLVLLAFDVCMSRRGFDRIKTLLVKGRGGDINCIGGKPGGKSASSREERICLL